MTRTTSLLWLVLLAACEDGPLRPQVELRSEPLRVEASEPSPAAAIESGRHEITVRHVFDLPDPCWKLSADVVESYPRQYLLRVFARGGGESCDPAEQRISYTAVVRDLPIGRSQLRVVHILSNGHRTARTVFEHPVLVTQ
jgi:hypothetical protein